MLIFCVIYCFWHTMLCILNTFGRQSPPIGDFCFFTNRNCFLQTIDRGLSCPEIFNMRLCFGLWSCLTATDQLNSLLHPTYICIQDVINLGPPNPAQGLQWQIFNKEWDSWSVSYVLEKSYNTQSLLFLPSVGAKHCDWLGMRSICWFNGKVQGSLRRQVLIVFASSLP